MKSSWSEYLFSRVWKQAHEPNIWVCESLGIGMWQSPRYNGCLPEASIIVVLTTKRVEYWWKMWQNSQTVSLFDPQWLFNGNMNIYYWHPSFWCNCLFLLSHHQINFMIKMSKLLLFFWSQQCLAYVAPLQLAIQPPVWSQNGGKRFRDSYPQNFSFFLSSSPNAQITNGNNHV